MAYGKTSKKRYMRRKSPVRRKTARLAAMVPKRKKRGLRPAQVKLTRPMRTLVDRRVNAHLETYTTKNALWAPTDGRDTTYYTLRPAITELSVATIIPRIFQDYDPNVGPYRRGNTIHPKFLILRLRLYVDQNDTVYGDQAGDRCAIQPYVFVGTHKGRKSYETLTQNNWECLADFWRCNTNFGTTDQPGTGYGEAKGFSGKRTDFVSGNLNSACFAPISGGTKTWALTRPLAYAVPAGGVTASGGAGFAIPYNGREFTFKIPCPAKLKYTDDQSEYPSNFCPFVAIGFTYMSGAEPNDEAPLRVESNVHFSYTDA